MADRLSQLDANQVIRRAGLGLSNPDTPSGGGIPVYSIGGKLVPEKYDDIQLTYLGATDNVETATYFLGTTEICTLTLTYDGSNRVTRVQRTEP